MTTPLEESLATRTDSELDVTARANDLEYTPQARAIAWRLLQQRGVVPKDAPPPDPPPIVEGAKPKPDRFGNAVVGLIAVGLAKAFGKYVGGNVLPPGLAGAVLWFGIKKLAPSRAKVRPAVTALGAHVSWMGLGALFAPEQAPTVLPDIFLFGAGAIWLLARPGRIVIGLLASLEVIAIVLNCSVMFDQTTGAAGQQGLLVHVAVRLLALGGLAYAWWSRAWQPTGVPDAPVIVPELMAEKKAESNSP